MSVDLIRYDLLVQDALRGVVRRVLTDIGREGLPGDHHLYISFDTGAPGVRLSPRLKEMYPEKMTIVLQHQFWDLIVTEQFFEVGLSFKGVPERLHVPFDALKEFVDPSVKFGLQFEPFVAEPAAEAATQAPAAPAPTGPRAVPDRPRPPRGAGSEPEETPSLAERRRTTPAATPPTSVPATQAPRPAPSVARAEPAKDAARPAAKEPGTDAGKSDAGKSDAGKSDAGKAPASPAPPAAETPEAPASGGAQVVRLDTFRKK